MLVIGTVLLLGAAVLTPLAFRAVRRWSVQRAIAEVRPRAVATRTGQEVRIAGIAVPGPDGVIESRLARTDCVWHGHEVSQAFTSQVALV